MLIIKQKTWHTLLIVHLSIVGIFALILIYYAIAGSFSGVDGGMGLAAGLIYVFIGAIYTGILYLVQKITAKWPIIHLIIFIIAITVPITGLTAIGIYSFNENADSARLEKIKPAFQSCTITAVDWQYDPAKTLITYSDRLPYTSSEYISPTTVDGLVSSQEFKCETSIKYLMNGEVPNNRK